MRYSQTYIHLQNHLRQCAGQNAAWAKSCFATYLQSRIFSNSCMRLFCQADNVRYFSHIFKMEVARQVG